MNELNTKLLKDHFGNDADVCEQHINDALKTFGVGFDKTAHFDEKFCKLTEHTVALIASRADQIVTFVK